MRPSSCVPTLIALSVLACGDQGPGGPAGDISMITPFVANADIVAINEAFSSSASAPWGFAHNGVDFTPVGDWTLFQSVASGTTEAVQFWQNNISGNWQVNVRVRYNSRYAVEYIFEPFAADSATAQAQFDSIAVGPGQVLSPGQPIGRLHTIGGGAHVHFGLQRDGVAVCPEPYFTAAARDSVLALIHKDHPTWGMCY